MSIEKEENENTNISRDSMETSRETSKENQKKVVVPIVNKVAMIIASHNSFYWQYIFGSNDENLEEEEKKEEDLGELINPNEGDTFSLSENKTRQFLNVSKVKVKEDYFEKKQEESELSTASLKIKKVIVKDAIFNLEQKEREQSISIHKVKQIHIVENRLEEKTQDNGSKSSTIVKKIILEEK